MDTLKYTYITREVRHTTHTHHTHTPLRSGASIMLNDEMLEQFS